MPEGKSNLHIIKLGGKSLETAEQIDQLASELALAPGSFVIVHGGGARVSAWCRKLGIEPSFVNGLRVTDPGTLEVAVSVLAGLANKELTAALSHAGLRAAGLSGVDGGLVACSLDVPELGAVGRIENVDPTIVQGLLAAGFTPVVASIGAMDGHLLNINADDMAAALAAGLGATSLTLFSDVPGLSLDGRLVADLTLEGLEDALLHPDVKGGMEPKLKAALAAIRGGVARVHIAAWAGTGTLAALENGDIEATTIGTFKEAAQHV